MLAPETLTDYRTWIEYRVLLALEKRGIEYLTDVTGTITEAVCDLGKSLGFTITLEKQYQAVLPRGTHHRSDVHWHGAVEHIWEIDNIIKKFSATKLLAAREPEKIWVLWAKGRDLAALRLMHLEGIDIIILSPGIRKLIWDRIQFEKNSRLALQDLLARNTRFHIDLMKEEPTQKPGKEDKAEGPGV